MSQKLLKAKKTKIAPKEDAVVETDVVLVGTYKEKQLAWIKANGAVKLLCLQNDPARPFSKAGKQLGFGVIRRCA